MGFEEKAKRITFFHKKAILCPICDETFYREELLSGSGRLIAGKLSDDMRRNYEPSKKYGELFPLIYPVIVCHRCYYAAYAKDFLIPEGDLVTILNEDRENRIDSVSMIFKNLNFKEIRDIKEGAASYYLAIMCYDKFGKKSSPTIKQGISCIRSAWLYSDLHRKMPNENYDYLSLLFYRKARFFYNLAIEKEQTGEETMSVLGHLGPDLDKNYGYDGVLYITGFLEFKYGPKKNKEKRILYLDKAKQIISRVHGMGRASKNKPSALLDKVKDLYTEINNEIKSLKDNE